MLNRPTYKLAWYAAIFQVLVLLPWPSLAANTTVQMEIDHLLTFVKNSNCAMLRNGNTYSGTQAHAHILKKYRWYRKRIKSAEGFIAYAATKSTLSGVEYTVSCAGKASIKTRLWLLEELQRFRQDPNSHMQPRPYMNIARTPGV